MMTNDKMDFTTEEWKQLPLALRQKFWEETNFAKRPPSDALLAELRAALEKS